MLGDDPLKESDVESTEREAGGSSSVHTAEGLESPSTPLTSMAGSEAGLVPKLLLDDSITILRLREQRTSEERRRIGRRY